MESCHPRKLRGVLPPCIMRRCGGQATSSSRAGDPRMLTYCAPRPSLSCHVPCQRRLRCAGLGDEESPSHVALMRRAGACSSREKSLRSVGRGRSRLCPRSRLRREAPNFARSSGEAHSQQLLRDHTACCLREKSGGRRRRIEAIRQSPLNHIARWAAATVTSRPRSVVAALSCSDTVDRMGCLPCSDALRAR